MLKMLYLILHTIALTTYIEAIHKENTVSLSYSFYPLFAVPQRKTFLQRQDKVSYKLLGTIQKNGGTYSVHKSGFHLTPRRGLTLAEPAVSRLPLTNSAAKEGWVNYLSQVCSNLF